MRFSSPKSAALLVALFGIASASTAGDNHALSVGDDAGADHSEHIDMLKSRRDAAAAPVNVMSGGMVSASSPSGDSEDVEAHGQRHRHDSGSPLQSKAEQKKTQEEQAAKNAATLHSLEANSPYAAAVSALEKAFPMTLPSGVGKQVSTTATAASTATKDMKHHRTTSVPRPLEKQALVRKMVTVQESILTFATTHEAEPTQRHRHPHHHADDVQQVESAVKHKHHGHDHIEMGDSDHRHAEALEMELANERKKMAAMDKERHVKHPHQHPSSSSSSSSSASTPASTTTPTVLHSRSPAKTSSAPASTSSDPGIFGSIVGGMVDFFDGKDWQSKKDQEIRTKAQQQAAQENADNPDNYLNH